jgi:hypothetical protein
MEMIKPTTKAPNNKGAESKAVIRIASFIKETTTASVIIFT